MNLIDLTIKVIIIFCVFLLWILYTRFFGAEWVKVPKEARRSALKLLKLNKHDVFYDLGCGDGQLLLDAAPKVKQAVGIELDPIRFLIAKLRVKNKRNVKIIWGNLFNKNLAKATKLFVFLSKEANQKLGKKLSQELHSALVVSYKWPLPELKLVERFNRLFLYEKI